MPFHVIRIHECFDVHEQENSNSWSAEEIRNFLIDSDNHKWCTQKMHLRTLRLSIGIILDKYKERNEVLISSNAANKNDRFELTLELIHQKGSA